jgi:hypothetical protein
MGVGGRKRGSSCIIKGAHATAGRRLLVAGRPRCGPPVSSSLPIFYFILFYFLGTFEGFPGILGE